MSEPPQAHDPATLRLVLAQIEARMGRLDANITKIDTKATTLLGFVLALTTFLGSQNAGGWWMVAPFVGLAAAAYFAIQAMRVRKYSDAPEPRVLVDQVAARSESAALTLVVKAKIKAFDANHRTHESKAKSWRWSLAALIVAVILAVAVLLFGGVMSTDANDNQGEASPSSAPSPTDAEIIDSLVGTESKGSSAVSNMVDRLVTTNEFTRKDDGSGTIEL